MTDFGSNFYYFHIMRIISSTSANPMSAAAMLLSPDLHNLTQLTEALTRVQHPTREPQNQVEEFLSIPREHRRTPYVNEERCRTCLRSATMLPRTINHRATCPELTGINNADHIFNNTVGAIRNRYYLFATLSHTWIWVGSQGEGGLQPRGLGEGKQELNSYCT
jgi:hypothetical protein